MGAKPSKKKNAEAAPIPAPVIEQQPAENAPVVEQLVVQVQDAQEKKESLDELQNEVDESQNTLQEQQVGTFYFYY
jgi:small-conductance mechanosensitive channel